MSSAAIPTDLNTVVSDAVAGLAPENISPTSAKMFALERITSQDSFKTASRESTTTVEPMASSSQFPPSGTRRSNCIHVSAGLKPRAFQDRFRGACRGHYDIRTQHRRSCIWLGVRVVPVDKGASVFWVSAPDANLIELSHTRKGFQVSLSLYAATEESEHATVRR